MNVRERFLEVMLDFKTDVPAPKWEFGYWGDTINNWYSEGLEKRKPPRIPSAISTPTASLYNTCWQVKRDEMLPAGIAVIGGGLYWPTQGFPLDNDVKDSLGMDKGQILVNVNLLFHPMFEVEILEEDDHQLTYCDVDGVKRKFLKDTGVIPSGVEWVIKDRRSWERLKDERLNTKNIRGRFPANWNELLTIYRNRDFPLVLGGYPHGYFGTLAQLMGYERLFYSYFDDPALIHDIMRTFTEVWIAVYSEVLSQTDVDLFIFWEDISAGSGSMVSPSMIREFILPYYRRMTDFLKEHGVRVIFVDTDGNCFNIIPLFVEGGVTGIYPIEVSCGMDLYKVRMTFPKLQLMGGIPKLEIRYGKERIDRILETVESVLKFGGYVPFGDHLIPPEVHWNEFKYYRERLNKIIAKR
ncbi:MAG: uroporphyrinogen decarboxylase family protein [Spirochaetota bacterium]